MPRCHKYIVSRACQMLFNASDSSRHGDGSASLFPSHGVLAYSLQPKKHLFMKRYCEELKNAIHSGATVPQVKSIASKKRGRPLTLGDVDIKVQAYIKALRIVGTPVLL